MILGRRWTGAVAIAGLFAQPGAQTRYVVYGPVRGDAADSCGVWTQANLPGLPTQEAEVLNWWVLGYVSGAGMVLAKNMNTPMTETDSSGIRSWVNKYCAEHPLEELPMAANRLVLELVGKAKK
jgi:hypothetical protein